MTKTEQLYEATLTCADCGALLNTAKHVPENEMSKVTISSALAAGSCPNGCRATFSDLNINTKLEWNKESANGKRN